MMDVPAFVQDQITMVPIRFVSEHLKQNIDFNNETREITITSSGAGSASSGSSSGSTGGSSGGSAGGSGGASGSGNVSSSYGGSASSGGYAVSSVDYFIGSWKMWVPAGQQSADGGILTIYADGTINYYWNGPKTGTWEYDEASGKLFLTGYKSGWDWTVSQSDKGITVSTLGVYETGTRIE